MVRLKVRVPSADVERYFARYMNDPNISNWEDRRFNKYRYNWSFEFMSIFGQVSFWVGFSHNSEKVGLKHNLVLEYNPNKCDEVPYLKSILKAFYRDFESVEVVSVDVACDMPVNILDVLYIPDGRRKYRYFNNGSDDVTYYFGNRSEDGAVKIYNKARELGIDSTNLTRYEITRRMNIPLLHADIITLKWDCLVDVRIIENYQGDLTIGQTERALLYAVMNGFPMSGLSRVFKDKIKKILSESAVNTLDSTLFGNCINLFFTQLKNTINSL
jgi:hypothetical protein